MYKASSSWLSISFIADSNAPISISMAGLITINCNRGESSSRHCKPPLWAAATRLDSFSKGRLMGIVSQFQNLKWYLTAQKFIQIWPRRTWLLPESTPSGGHGTRKKKTAHWHWARPGLLWILTWGRDTEPRQCRKLFFFFFFFRGSLRERREEEMNKYRISVLLILKDKRIQDYHNTNMSMNDVLTRYGVKCYMTRAQEDSIYDAV